MDVGFIYNLATDEFLHECPELALNLTDSQETIDAVASALEAGGHTVTRLNADRKLPAILAEARVDIAFNIATGIYGETRQAHVPAMLEYLQIPHTGGGVLAEAICHHKPTMKMVVAARGLSTAPFQIFESATDPLNPGLRFPMIVKLPSEGGSLGLDYDSIVNTEAALRKRLAYVIAKYRQGALVEDYLNGREFSVTVLGNRQAYALPVAELLFHGSKPIRLDEPDWSTFERLKRLSARDLTFRPMETHSVAPADLPPDLAARIQAVAITAFKATGCQDWARIDLRMDSAGAIHVLDINLEPGIGPDYIVFKSAQATGWSYTELINRILQHAIERYPHLLAMRNEQLLNTKPDHAPRLRAMGR